MNNRVFLKIVLVVTCFAVIMAIGYPGMYGAWPSPSPSDDSNAYVMPTPLPENSPDAMPQASPTPAFVVTPVPEEPEQMPTYFPAPGEEVDDPNLTPKQNCEKRQKESYDSCIESLDMFPEMDQLDCQLSRDQDGFSCSCEEPVSPAYQDVCSNACLRDLKNCDLISTHKEVRCLIEGKARQSCLDARRRIINGASMPIILA